jgi:predicted alpha/beta hydrolase
MGVAARSYDPLLRGLAAAGSNAAAFDLRGGGDSSVRAGRRTDFGYRVLLEQEIPSAVSATVELFPGHPIILLGHSLGGQLAALYAAGDPRIAGLILVASGSVHFRCWRFPWNLLLLLGTAAAEVIARLVGHFPGRLFGFAGREARGVIRDWRRQAWTGRYELYGSTIDHEARLATMRPAILAVAIADDRFAPEAALRQLCTKMNPAAIDCRRLARPSGERGRPHFAWMRHPADVVAAAAGWIDGLAAVLAEP